MTADGTAWEDARDLLAGLPDGRGANIGFGAVFNLLGRGLTTYVAALGTLKHTSAFSPLFAAFGPEPTRSCQRPLSARPAARPAS